MKEIFQPGDICLMRFNKNAICLVKLEHKIPNLSQWHCVVKYNFSHNELYKVDSVRQPASFCLEKFDVVKLGQLRMCIDNLINDIVKTQTT